jgi:hypothetical protein
MAYEEFSHLNMNTVYIHNNYSSTNTVKLMIEKKVISRLQAEEACPF